METPSQILVDTEKDSRSVVMTPGLIQAVPNLQTAFLETDSRYQESPYNYLDRMHASVFRFNQNGQEVACSLIYDSETSKKDEILVMFAPFSDGPPETSAATMHRYINAHEAGLADKEKAKPNTWNQTTKSAVVHDLLAALGEGMPVLTIYSPVPPKAYSRAERKSIRQGDISPVARTAIGALSHAQQILHGAGSETRLDTVHTHGASLGDNAIGAASVLTRRGIKQVESVTAQELILMDGSLGRLADRYVFRPITGEESDIPVPSLAPLIYEPAVRQVIDRHGSEPSTYWRVVKAMTKLSYLVGLTNPDWLSRQVEYLADQGVPVTVANARNSSVSQDTAEHLPLWHPDLKFITIEAAAGQKVGHLADEYVALVATVIALGIKRSRR